LRTLISDLKPWSQYTKEQGTLEAIGVSNNFFSRTQATRQLRERIGKWDYMKFKSFCTAKEMVSKLKWPLTEWEYIFTSYT
jgi:hypothetical protein